MVTTFHGSQGKARNLPTFASFGADAALATLRRLSVAPSCLTSEQELSRNHLDSSAVNVQMVLFTKTTLGLDHL
jgi:hypothetical protein